MDKTSKDQQKKSIDSEFLMKCAAAFWTVLWLSCSFLSIYTDGPDPFAESGLIKWSALNFFESSRSLSSSDSPPFLFFAAFPFISLLGPSHTAFFITSAAIVILTAVFLYFLTKSISTKKTALLSYILFLQTFMAAYMVRNYIFETLLTLSLTAVIYFYLKSRLFGSYWNSLGFILASLTGALTKYSFIPAFEGIFYLYLAALVIWRAVPCFKNSFKDSALRIIKNTAVSAVLGLASYYAADSLRSALLYFSAASAVYSFVFYKLSCQKDKVYRLNLFIILTSAALAYTYQAYAVNGSIINAHVAHNYYRYPLILYIKNFLPSLLSWIVSSAFVQTLFPSALLSVFGIILCCSNKRLRKQTLPIWLGIFAPAVFAFILPNEHVYIRFLAPLIPLFSLSASIGAAKLKNSGRGGLIICAASLLLISAQAYSINCAEFTPVLNGMLPRYSIPSEGEKLSLPDLNRNFAENLTASLQLPEYPLQFYIPQSNRMEWIDKIEELLSNPAHLRRVLPPSLNKISKVLIAIEMNHTLKGGSAANDIQLRLKKNRLNGTAESTFIKPYQIQGLNDPRFCQKPSENVIMLLACSPPGPTDMLQFDLEQWFEQDKLELLYQGDMNIYVMYMDKDKKAESI